MNLRYSELFHSLQGEGPSTGTPAHFLRLQGCDVGCRWCDTRYTWPADGGTSATWAEVRERLQGLGRADLIVVTGGEPLAHAGIAELLALALESWPRVEVETSGIAAPPLRHERLFYNHSPKLPSVTERWQDTWRHAGAFAADPNTTTKIVIGDDPDTEDALRLIRTHELPRNRVMLMSEGLTDAALRARAQSLAELCKREGLRFSPRLHVWLWGARRGV
ncbi:MAG: 7-carboxy-7-deazaguanine synthase QueE [Candidatus Eisenbacteria bacterium]